MALQGTDVVTRLRRTDTGTVDRYGNAIMGGWLSTTLTDLALLDPGGSREPAEVGRAQTVTTPKLYFPGAYPDILHTDRVTVRGHTYSVQGRPADWQVGGIVGGLVVELQEVSDG